MEENRRISHKEHTGNKDHKGGKGDFCLDLLLLQVAAFTGATLCGIVHLHGYAVRLFSVCEFPGLCKISKILRYFFIFFPPKSKEFAYTITPKKSYYN
jgi:hypothetical protein